MFTALRVRTVRWHLLVLPAVTLLFVLCSASGAFADDGSGELQDLDEVRDSRGVPASHYKVPPIDRGGLDNIPKLLTSWLVDQLWPTIMQGVEIGLQVLNWTLSFEWLRTIATPFIGFANAIQELFGGLAFIPFALSLTGLVYGIAMLRGKYGHGALRMIVAAVLAAAITGVLANPASTVLGPNGLLTQAANLGSQVSVSLAADGRTAVAGEPDQNDNLDPGARPPAPGADPTPAPTTSASRAINATLSRDLVDVFLREPAMYVAFGKRLTGECERVFDQKMKGVKPGDRQSTDVVDAVTSCDEDAKFYVDNPVGQIDLIGAVLVAVAAFWALAVLVSLLIIISAAIVGWKLTLFMFQSILALLPGGAIGAVLNTAMGVLAGIVSMATSLVALVLYFKFVVMILRMLDVLGAGKYLLLAVLFVCGPIMIFIFRRRLHDAAQKASARISSSLKSQPGPAPQPVTGAQVSATAQRMYGAVQTSRLGRSFRENNTTDKSSTAAPVKATTGQGSAGSSSKSAGKGGAPTSDPTAVESSGSTSAPQPFGHTLASKGFRSSANAALRKTLTAAQAAPGPVGIAAKGANVAGKSVAATRRFGQKMKATSDLVTDESTRRSYRNERLRNRIGEAETKQAAKTERLHQRADRVDAKREQINPHNARRLKLDHKEQALMHKASTPPSERTEKLREKLQEGQAKERAATARKEAAAAATQSRATARRQATTSPVPKPGPKPKTERTPQRAPETKPAQDSAPTQKPKREPKPEVKHRRPRKTVEPEPVRRGA